MLGAELGCCMSKTTGYCEVHFGATAVGNNWRLNARVAACSGAAAAGEAAKDLLCWDETWSLDLHDGPHADVCRECRQPCHSSDPKGRICPSLAVVDPTCDAACRPCVEALTDATKLTTTESPTTRPLCSKFKSRKKRKQCRKCQRVSSKMAKKGRRSRCERKKHRQACKKYC